MTAVLQHSGGRVAEAEALAKLQLAESALRCDRALYQANAELERTKGMTSSRLREAVGQLMMYLDTEDGKQNDLSAANLNLELWIPVPSDSPVCT